MRARDYDPGDGRFLTQDVHPYNLGNPIELNRYAYAANSPTNLSDPTEYTALTDYAINVGKGAVGGAVIGGLSTELFQYK